MTDALLHRVRPAVWLTICALVLAFWMALGTVATVLVSSARVSALNDNEAKLTNFVSVADAVLNRVFLSVDVLLASTDDLLDLSTSMVAWPKGDATSALLHGSMRQNQLVRSMAILDDHGVVVASSHPDGADLQLQLPDRFLERVLAPSMSSLVVSAPAAGFFNGEKVLYFSRYFRVSDGTQLVAVAEVTTATLMSILLQGVDIKGLEVTLERADGDVLLSTARTGQAALAPAPERLGTTAPETPTWEQTMRLGDASGFVVVRPIWVQDLWLTAGMSMQTALAGWKQQQRTIWGTALVLGLMVALAGVLAYLYLQRMGRARSAIAQSKATLDQALQSMVSGFMLLDEQHRVVQWNQHLETLFPWLLEVLAPQVPFRRVLEVAMRFHMPDGSPAEHHSWIERRLHEQRSPHAAREQSLPSGRIVQITERRTPSGGLVIMYHDVTELRQASVEIETLAFYDTLTGLPNRRLLMDRLQQAGVGLSRSGHQGAVLFLDLDHFKMVNDTQGHETGDELLRQVAQRLTAAVRDTDTVARLGGDEFVVMLTDLSSDREEAAAQAQRLGEKVLHSLHQPYLLGTYVHNSTCSAGATLFGASEQSAAELLRQADIAMYEIKAQRGNGLCFFDPQMQTMISQRAQLESDLQVALQQNQLVLYYQPQFTLDGRIVGAEALLRWQQPQRGMVSPADFIPVAEESGLIVQMGQWVLHTVCQQLAAWQEDERYAHLQMAANVSARQFRHADFVPQVLAAMQEAKIRPHLLKLELTESLVLDNVDAAIAKMHQLRTRGVQFSVDDFGTGYSSLAYLTNLPLHQLKIDQSFVRNLGQRATDDVIVQTIIGMASNLGLEVIAEGVETLEQKEFLALHGCHLYQGYLFGRPMPVAQLEALLNTQDAVLEDQI